MHIDIEYVIKTKLFLHQFEKKKIAVKCFKLSPLFWSFLLNNDFYLRILVLSKKDIKITYYTCLFYKTTFLIDYRRSLKIEKFVFEKQNPQKIQPDFVKILLLENATLAARYI